MERYYGAVLGRPRRRVRLGDQGGRDLLRHLRTGGHRRGLLHVPRLLPAAQGPLRQRDGEGRPDRDPEAGQWRRL
jgi:hypothetical protein